MKILAIICVRNEAQYLEVLVPYLAAEGVEIALIDNDSSDGTLDLFSSQKYPNIIEVTRLPFYGVFDLSGQLEAKDTVAARSAANWLIHQDADEILHSPSGWGGLRQSIEVADSAGFNVLNFNELVMLPADPEVDDIMQNNSNCYFFEPRPLRLMRAWKREANLTSRASGGHILSGQDIHVSPQLMIMKHFIVRSQVHALQKYLRRSFSATDLRKGWHSKRLSFTENNLKIPEYGENIHKLASPKSTLTELPRGVRAHYWDWPQPSD